MDGSDKPWWDDTLYEQATTAVLAQSPNDSRLRNLLSSAMLTTDDGTLRMEH